MKITMLKNFWRSGVIELEQGKKYETPKDLSEKFASALVSAGKAIETAEKTAEKPKRKKVT
ncbi:MAG: hypothetical protein WCY59_01575 [Anaerovoracaceae bacterium]|nr:hypothetical protein [Dehalococcoidia bacterium]